MSAYAKAKPFAKSAEASSSASRSPGRSSLARGVLLLDEPRLALDANLRRQMQVELKDPAARGRHYLRLCHPRPGRSYGHVRPHRASSGRANSSRLPAPREIYSRPATAIRRQFIGHTNLLKAEVSAGIAREKDQRIGVACIPAGRPRTVLITPGMYSALRAAPLLRLSKGGSVRFQAKVRDRVFHGAKRTRRVESADGQVLTVRTSSRALSGDDNNAFDFEFCAADAIPVQPSEERV